MAVDLSDATLSNVNADHTRFAATNFTGTRLHGGVYTGADFSGADLRRVITERGYTGLGAPNSIATEWQEDVEGPPKWPRLFGKDLGPQDALRAAGRLEAEGTDNYLVDFSEADFTETDLRGTDLRNSNISQSQINKACIDETTHLPEGRANVNGCNLFPQTEETRRRLQALTHRSVLNEQSCDSALGAIEK